MTVLDLFAAQVARTPEATAVVSGAQRLTFAELDRRSARLARRLTGRGVGPETLVGLCVDRGVHMAVGVLAVLRSGGAFVPLDPAYPHDRLAWMTADSGVPLVLTTAPLARRLFSGGPDVLCVEEASGEPGEQDGFDRGTVAIGPDTAAYLMYTSGSTGTPKGVVVEHRNLSAVQTAWEELHGLSRARLRFLSVSSLSVDLFMADLLRSVFAGGSIVIAPREAVTDPALLLRLLDETGGDAMELVPSLAKALAREAAARHRTLPPLRLLSVGSEAWLAEDCRELLSLVHPDTTVVNAYGATETTIDTCAYVLRAGQVPDGPLVPLGTPVPGAAVHVLDDRMRPVPDGRPGELWVGGDGVVRGYHRRPRTTAERFVPDPDTPGRRLYRTGDLARRRPDGVLEFLGRRDEQVKVRGFRVETGEVENALVRHPGVAAAAVTVRAGRLVGHVVPAGPGLPDLAEVRAVLARQLPDHMVPSVLVPLDRLPVLPGGKVDRAALPGPSRPDPADSGHGTPRTDAERLLAAIWADVLGVPGVGVHDDFIALGGDSVLAMQAVVRARTALGADLPVRALFDHRTVAALARAAEDFPPLGTGGPDHGMAGAAAGRRTLPLAPTQHRLWFLHAYAPGPQYTTGCALRLTGDLDPGALDEALTRLVARQEALRTTFETADGRALQVVHPPFPMAAEHTDLAALPEPGREQEVQRLLREEAGRLFDLERGPLLRARLVRLSDTEHVLVLAAHHIVTDDWSYEVMAAELGAHYTAVATGTPADLPALPVRYADYSVWRRRGLAGGRDRELREHWRERLAGVIPLALPADRTRTTTAAGAADVVRTRVPGDVAERLRRIGHAHGTTLFTTLLAACHTFFARHTGQRDVALGTVTSGRDHAALDDLVGFFVNTVVIRATVDEDLPFTALLGRVREAVLDAVAHDELPFDRLVEDLAPVREAGRTPLVPALVLMRNAPARERHFHGLSVTETGFPAVGAAFELTVEFQDTGDGLDTELRYATDLFDRATAEAMAARLTTLLAAVSEDPGLRLARLELLPGAERDRLLTDWNATGDPVTDGLVHETIAAHARRAPHATALTGDGTAIDYAGLDSRANRLAHHLAACGAGPEDLVGLCLDRGADLVVAALAVLRTGAAFVPLDPAQPAERLGRMVADAAPRVVLAHERHLPLLPEDAAVVVVCVDREPDKAAVDRCPPTPPDVPVHPDNLAYVVYTSGSTGRPKGVAVRHAALCNLAADSRHSLGLRPGARMAQHLSFGFDGGIWQVLMPLMNGATVCMTPPGAAADPARLTERIRQDRVTVLMLPPALLGLLDPADLPGLERVCSAADVCPPGTAAAWLATHPFANLYGPTETTMCSTAHLMPRGHVPGPRRPLPIGAPVRGVRHYVLDARLRPVPTGVTGELHIAGAGLARGYHGRPADTAARFVADPWGRPGDRMYRTGDLVRRRSDGTLEFLGRADHQVKIRGYRVEPAEATAALLRHPDVAEAVVTTRDDGPGDGPRLVAHIVARPGTRAPDGAGLRRFLAGLLPPYLIPSAFVPLDALPLNASGKVDGGALPAPDGRRDAETAYVPPGTPQEEALAAVWQEVLETERVGVEDDFFALGGDSITSVRLVARARAEGFACTPEDVFLRRTVRALARTYTGRPPARPATCARPDTGPAEPAAATYPLTALQAGLLFHSLAGDGSDVYARRVVVTITGVTDPYTLARAWQEVVDRTPALRSLVGRDGTGRHVQTVRPAFTVPVAHRDWRHVPTGARGALLERLLEEVRAEECDPRRDVPLRLAVARLTDDEVQVVWSCHHLFVDGWSIAEVLSDVFTAYAALARDREPVLPPRRPFGDYVHWLAARDDAGDRAFWRAALEGFPGPTPLPYGRTPAVGHRPRPSAARTVTLSGPGHRRLRDAARRHGLTVNTFVQAAWALLLARHGDTDDVVFGATVSHRSPELAGAESVIGLLINTLPVRVRVDEDARVLDWLRTLQAEQARARQHDAFPLPNQAANAGLPPGTSLFHTAVAFDNVPVEPGSVASDGLRVTALETGNSTHYPLSLLVYTTTDLVFEMRYDPGLYDEEDTLRLAGQLRGLLTALAAVPDGPVCDVALPPGPDGAATPGAPEPRCAHELFAEQVARTSAATAVVGTGGEVTYAELDARTDGLARLLRQHGVGAETVVGVAVPRGPGLAVAVLAVLKAGGVCLPLDPALPAARLAWMLVDAGAAVLVTGDATVPAWCPAGLPVVAVDGQPHQEPGRTAPRPRIRPGNAAYVIYTSGSTGRPKATAVTHQGLTGMLAGACGAAGPGPGDRVLQFASVSFDAAFWELSMALFTGAALVTVPAERLLPGPELVRTVTEYGVTHVTLPPAVLAVLPPDGLPTGLVLHVAGERCPAEVAGRWAAGRRMFNAYGPTEATVCATVSSRLDGDREPPIGSPVPGMRALVLDRRLRRVPPGVPGELHLAGPGLARGYPGRPALTAGRFVACPYGPPGSRMYRTGDVVVREPDGALRFLGRSDDQVKVRGFRVEPGEVEAVLRAHPGVAQAAVVAVGTQQRRRLTARIVPAPGGPVPTAAAIRAHLTDRLPAHLVPSAIGLVEALPLTSRGKVDRQALAAAPVPREDTGPAPRTAAERAVAALWADLLDRGPQEIGAREKFFEAGGSSLTLLELAGRLGALGGTEIPVAALLDRPTVEAMARLLAERTGGPADDDGNDYVL
ncbi:amino acid adenylation domain-containing protein [Streptomyces sp. NPDC001135]